MVVSPWSLLLLSVWIFCIKWNILNNFCALKCVFDFSWYSFFDSWFTFTVDFRLWTGPWLKTYRGYQVPLNAFTPATWQMSAIRHIPGWDERGLDAASFANYRNCAGVVSGAHHYTFAVLCSWCYWKWERPLLGCCWNCWEISYFVFHWSLLWKLF